MATVIVRFGARAFAWEWNIMSESKRNKKLIELKPARDAHDAI